MVGDCLLYAINAMKIEECSNSEMSNLIANWIQSERDRNILKRRMIDGLRYEAIAEEFDLSVRQVKNIVYRDTKIIALKLHENFIDR